MKKYLLLIIISFGFFACTSKKADMIIYNGNIYTVNDLNPLVSAVAVKDGKILDLGDWQKLKKYKYKSKEIFLERENLKNFISSLFKED